MAETPNEATLALLLPGGDRRPLPAKGAWIVGSDAGCELVLEGPGVSGRHLTVAPLKSGGYGVKVLDADADTRLNGKRVRSARLEKGDRLRLGELELVLVSPKSSKTALVAAARARAAEESGRLPQIPGLKVERALGRGSHGVVYLALQENLQRQVALKLLSKKLSQDAAFVERFQDEARAAAALHHANVATVFDVGEHEGRPYLLMEYMDQGSVEDRLTQSGRLPWRAVLGILRDAAAGLEYAESKGIVHRDIKPANLMQTSGGGTKIVDLGLAAAASEETGGKIQGTPHFMPPEQARGEAVDTRADLYALGASAWRMLTGETPFQGADARAILRAVQEQPLPNLSEVADDVPSGVQALIESLMRKDPDARPRSATQAREQIERLIQGQAAPASGGGGGAATKSRAPKALVSLVVAAVLIGAAAFLVPDLLSSDKPAPDDGQPDANGNSGVPEVVDGGAALVDVEPGSGEVASGQQGSTGTDPQSTASSTEENVTAQEGSGDEELAALEAQANSALELVSTLSDASARRTALLELAATYPGTTAASRALDQARSMAAELAGSTTPNEGGATQEPAPGGNVLNEGLEALDPRVQIEAQLRELVYRSDGELLAPQVAFDQLGSYSALEGSATEQVVAETLTALRTELGERYAARQAAVLEQAYADVSDGKFEIAEGNLREHYAWLMQPGPNAAVDEAAQRAARERAMDPLEVADGGLTVAVRHQRSEIESAAALIAAMPGYEVRLEEYRRQGDRKTLAEACAPGGALRQALDRLDGNGLAKTWGDLQALLESNAYRERAESERLRAVSAARAWEVLRVGWDASEWRRNSIQLPGERRTVVDVLSVFADGLSVQGSSGPRTLSLMDFAGDPSAIDSLFQGRLTRSYTPVENAEIAAWIDLASIQSGLTRFVSILPQSGLPSVDDDLVDDFERDLVARARWHGGGASALVADPEAECIQQLADVLEAWSEGRYDSAAFALEQLLGTHSDQLLVWCLWSGEGIAQPVSWPPRPEEL